MRHWWLLATRSLRTKGGRSSLAVLSVTLGVGVVVWVTCCYESVRRGMTDVVLDWIGRSHVVVECTTGVWGVFDESVCDWVKDVPGIAKMTRRTREYVRAAGPPAVSGTGAATSAPTFTGEPALPSKESYLRIEVTGIQPDLETAFRRYDIIQGRMLTDRDRHSAVVESLLAQKIGLKIGDPIFLQDDDPPGPPRPFTVVGILDRRRASMNQALMAWVPLEEVQTLCSLPRRIKSLEFIAADPDLQNIRRIAADVQKIIDARCKVIAGRGETPPSLEVRTTEAQLKKLGAAQGLLEFVMMLLAGVVLLTACFIIVATMSMGVTERISELGLLRCIGVTRRQLSGLILLQAMPFGVLGVLFGVPMGLCLQWLTLQFVPDYLGHFAISEQGVALAIIGGLLMTLLGAASPATRAFEVSPIEAARSPADPNLFRLIWLSAAIGVVLIATHEIVLRSIADHESPAFDAKAIAAVVLLYLGAALLSPLIVTLLGRPAVRAAAKALGLRHELLGHEVQQAPFRSGAICSGLMVGLSLIVGLVVWGESVKQGWQFPKEFPDALLYLYDARKLDAIRALRDLDGVKDFTVTDDFSFSMRKPRKGGLYGALTVLESLQRFLAIDPDEGFKIVKLTFLEGDEKTALTKLKQGGHILITREFASAHKKTVGSKVRLWVEDRRGDFVVAGVIASPGLDIAISFFNAETYFQTYAVGAVVGTLDDAKRLFHRSVGKLLLMNFSFAESATASTSPEIATEFTPGKAVGAEGRPTFALSGTEPIKGNAPEIRLINEMLKRLKYPDRAFVTARELKAQIDRNITRVSLLLSAVPLVGLIVASLGLANLMAANVSSRSKQLAVLRSLGLTRGQLSRMVIGEALVLAFIGSASGLVLGIVLGRVSNRMTAAISGFQPEFAVPWGLVAAGAAIATIMCIVSALGPARYAGRTNIVAALQD